MVPVAYSPQWFMVFLCSLSFSVLCLSAVGFFERCFSDINSLALKILSVASINFRVIARLGGWLNQKFDLSFFRFSCQSSKSDFQNHESFQFFGFWLLFVNQSRVNLVFRKT